MAWQSQLTGRSVDVDLDDFSNKQLLQGLINAEWISELEAEAIAKRAVATEKTARVLAAQHHDRDELVTATEFLRRGQVAEARIHLERALGRDWMGVLS